MRAIHRRGIVVFTAVYQRAAALPLVVSTPMSLGLCTADKAGIIVECQADAGYSLWSAYAVLLEPAPPAGQLEPVITRSVTTECDRSITPGDIVSMLNELRAYAREHGFLPHEPGAGWWEI